MFPGGKRASLASLLDGVTLMHRVVESDSILGRKVGCITSGLVTHPLATPQAVAVTWRPVAERNLKSHERFITFNTSLSTATYTVASNFLRHCAAHSLSLTLPSVNLPSSFYSPLPPTTSP